MTDNIEYSDPITAANATAQLPPISNYKFTPVDHDPFSSDSELMDYAKNLPNTAAPMGFSKGDPNYNLFQDESIPLALRIPAAIGTSLAGNAYEGLKNIATLPGDVATGKLDPNSPEAIARSTQAALGLTLPAAGGEFDPNTLNIFAGPRAKTADLDAMRAAQIMAEKGVDRDTIWRNTGQNYGQSWGQDNFGNWFHEIPDDKMYLTEPAENELGNNPPGTRVESSMKNIMEHPELYSAYPSASGIRTSVSYNPQNPTGSAYFGLQGLKPEIGLNANRIDPLLNDSGLPKHITQQYSSYDYHPFDQDYGSVPELAAHELQHYVQARENWPPGAAFKSDAGDDAYRQYFNTPGERQARNAQYRIQMTPAQRQAIPPWYTEDPIQPPPGRQILNSENIANIPDRQSFTPVDHDPFGPK